MRTVAVVMLRVVVEMMVKETVLRKWVSWWVRVAFGALLAVVVKHKWWR